MSYEIFARKYRPWKFEEVVGQLSVVRTIQNAIASSRIAQAYLFSGVRGTGKTTVARILAKALNCADGPTPHPCPDKDHPCQFCKSIHEGSAIDVLEIDGASNRQVDDIEPIREMVKYKPVYTRTKVLIIDEVHMLSTHAFNALLKTLEEPPPNTVFIFATTEFDKVPATIVSRCQHFEFRKISRKDIINHLMEITRKEGITITPAGLALIAEAADGSMRDAQSLLDQAVAFSGENIGDEDLKTILGTIGQDLLMRFSSAILDETPGEVFGLVETVVSSGYDLRFVFGKLIEHFRALLLVRSVGKPEDLLAVSPEGLAALRAEAAKAGPEDLLRYLLALQQAEPGLKYSTMPRIYFEAFLVKLCHFRKIVPLRDLIRDVGSLKEGGPKPPVRPSGPAPKPAVPAGGASRPAPGSGPGPMPEAAPPKAAAPAPEGRLRPRPREAGRRPGPPGRPAGSVLVRPIQGQRDRGHFRQRPGVLRHQHPGEGHPGRRAGRLRGPGPGDQGPLRRRERHGRRPHPAGTGARVGHEGPGRPVLHGHLQGPGPVGRSRRRLARRRAQGPGPDGEGLMKNVMDLQKMLKSAKEMQDRLQKELAALRTEGSSGGGMVTVVLDGHKALQSIRIDPEVAGREDVEMLQDLIVAAFNDGAAKVDEALAEKLGGLGAGLKIPGLG